MSWWPAVPLGSVVTILGGGTPSKAEKSFWNGPIPWASVRDLKDRWLTSTEFQISEQAIRASASRIVPAGNVVICTRVGLGKVVQARFDLAINQDLKGLIPKEPTVLDPNFVFYWYKSIAGRVIAMGTGATVQGVRLDDISSLLVPLPPLDEQKRIVAKLDQAQSKLDRLESKLDLQLGAVDGLERAALNQEIAVSRVEQGSTCSASELAVSGWPLVQLAEVAKIDRQTGKHSGLRYVGLEDIQSGTGRLSATVQPRTVKSQTFRFGSEHVLYGRLRPYLNKFALPTFAGHCSTEIFPLLPSPRLSREFLAYWLSSSRICNEINETCHGARMPRADMDEVLTFEIPLPPLDEQKRIVAKLDAVQQELAALRERLYERRSLALSFRDRTLAAALVGDL